MSGYPFPEVLDSSILAVYKSCARKFYLEYIANWKNKSPSVHLHAGGAFAAGMEATRTAFHVNHWTSGEAIQAGLDKLAEFYGDFDCPPDSAKSLIRMLGAFEYYFDYYPLEGSAPPITLPGGKRAIEFNFAEPLPILHPETGNPILYCGRMDAINDFAGGNYICDEKTTSSLGPTWSRQWDLRAQFTGYAWGCGKAGIHIDGAIVRGVSILKTKYETQQAISYRHEWQINQWYSELLDWIEDMIRDWKRNQYRHNLDSACNDWGGCAFRDVCRSQDEGPWLATAFERRFWSPLTRTEILLSDVSPT